MKAKFLNILLQVPHSSEMANAADTGKFYVVVGIIAVLFAGIVAYLISLDRKIKKLEGK